MLFHHSQMHGVASGNTRVPKNDIFGLLHCGTIDGQYFVNDSEQGIKSWLNGVAAIHSNITVQNLLQDFSVGDQALAIAE